MKIHLHGYLKELYPKEITVKASSVAEAVSSLQLIPALNTGKLHNLVIPGFESRDALYDKTDVEEIHLHPVVLGAGKAGVAQTIIGIALIALSFIPGPYSAHLFITGASMVLGGVLQMMAPQPELPGSASSEEHSKYLGQPKNTVAIGTRIPLLYGRRKAFGHYISFDVDAVDLKNAPASWYASVFGPTGEIASGNAPLETQIPLPNDVFGVSRAKFLGVKTSLDINDTRKFVDYTPVLNILAGWYFMSFNSTGLTIDVVAVYESGVLKLVIPAGETIPAELAGEIFSITKINNRQI